MPSSELPARNEEQAAAVGALIPDGLRHLQGYITDIVLEHMTERDDQEEVAFLTNLFVQETEQRIAGHTRSAKTSTNRTSLEVLAFGDGFMRLRDDVLNQRIDAMPTGEEHQTVWHLCHEDRHLACSADIGALAMVTTEAPEIPDRDGEGLFLMRLHPLRKHVTEDESGVLAVRMPQATSFPHITVWSRPVEREESF